jgi:hypothetical protein
MKLNAHLYLVLKLRISGAIPALPYMPSWHVQGQLHTYFQEMEGIFYACLFLLNTGSRHSFGMEFGTIAVYVKNAKLAHFIMHLVSKLYETANRNYVPLLWSQHKSWYWGVGHGYIYYGFQHQYLKLRSHISVKDFLQWCDSK